MESFVGRVDVSASNIKKNPEGLPGCWQLCGTWGQTCK